MRHNTWCDFLQLPKKEKKDSVFILFTNAVFISLSQWWSRVFTVSNFETNHSFFSIHPFQSEFTLSILPRWYYPNRFNLYQHQSVGSLYKLFTCSHELCPVCISVPLTEHKHLTHCSPVSQGHYLNSFSTAAIPSKSN